MEGRIERIYAKIEDKVLRTLFIIRSTKEPIYPQFPLCIKFVGLNPLTWIAIMVYFIKKIITIIVEESFTMLWHIILTILECIVNITFDTYSGIRSLWKFFRKYTKLY